MTFGSIYYDFTNTPLWYDMTNTREDSPWHREANVAEHTRMVLRWYDENLAKDRSDVHNLAVRLAILFHDVGKPSARTPRTNEDGSVRFIYAGHEAISSRLFEDYMHSSSWPSAIRTVIPSVSWLIMNHLPYGLGPEKFEALVLDAMSRGGMVLVRMLADLLLSDTHGRISDDHPSKIAKVNTYILDLLAKARSLGQLWDVERQVDTAQPTLTILVGASGSGKSTYTSQHADHVFSLDTERLRYHAIETGELLEDVLYEDAFKTATTQEADFRKFWQNQFMTLIRSKVSLIVDNVNSSAKARRYFTTEARKHGYRVCAVEFGNSLQTLLSRQGTRSDKTVPADVVRHQYMKTVSPRVGAEVDELRYRYPDGSTQLIGYALVVYNQR